MYVCNPAELSHSQIFSWNIRIFHSFRKPFLIARKDTGEKIAVATF